MIQLVNFWFFSPIDNRWLPSTWDWDHGCLIGSIGGISKDTEVMYQPNPEVHPHLIDIQLAAVRRAKYERLKQAGPKWVPGTHYVRAQVPTVPSQTQGSG